MTGEPELQSGDTVPRQTLDVRDAYLAPLNALQTALLRRLRDNPDERDPDLVRALLLTLSGVAVGLGNTG